MIESPRSIASASSKGKFSLCIAKETEEKNGK
jgi:hypothetical protein